MIEIFCSSYVNKLQKQDVSIPLLVITALFGDQKLLLSMD